MTSLQVSIIVITWQMGNQFRYSIEVRQGNYDNIATSDQDKKDATRKAVDTNGTKAKTKKLKGIYKSKNAATVSAHAESKRIKDQQAKFSINLDYAYSTVSTERSITLREFKAKIDALKWTVDKALHTYSKYGGLTTQLDLLATL
jgi:hypothetical protein